MTEIVLTVNGQPASGDVSDRQNLADFLRDDLRLTGTHVGCEQGVCGACTVIVDGRPVRSCLMLAAQVHGSSVLTIEGLDQLGASLAETIRDAFHAKHGLQCGFCTPGFLIMTADLLRRKSGPDLDEKTVREELSGNLCRCTGYVNIVNSVLEANAHLQSTQHPATAR